MKFTGVVRPLDAMGRVVIPSELRASLNLTPEKDKLEIFVEGDTIVLRKFQPTCIFCGKLGESVEYEGYTVCRKCMEKMKEL